jgi:flagellar hook protein FlgE
MKVLGWTGADMDAKLQATAQPINLANQFMAASPTDRIAFQGNLDSRTAVGESIRHGVTLFDSLGGEHRVDFVFEKAASNEWAVTIEPEIGGAITAVAPSPLGATLVFNPDGSLDVTGSTFPATQIEFTLNPAVTGAANIIIPVANLVFDEERLTQYAVESSVRASEVSGYPAGSLTSLSLDNAGKVIGVFSNGQLNELALLAIANFNNPSGLTKIGDNLFENTVNSGFLGLDAAGFAGRGMVSPGTLEMSNVDLAKEFTDMIVAQRGFQANSRIITTSDELLQELVNIKR